MTQDKTPPHIKLGEGNHIDKSMQSRPNRPDRGITALMQDMLTGKVRATPLLEDGTP